MTEQNGREMSESKPKIPAWVLGLAIAVVVFVAVLLTFSALGYGDDPVVESLASAIQ